jgi:hypothetical protein
MCVYGYDHLSFSLFEKKDDRKHTEREEKKKEIDYPRYFFITKNERRKEEKAYIFPYDGIDSSL